MKNAIGQKINALRCLAMTGAASLMNTVFAYADANETSGDIQGAVDTVFGVAATVTEAITSGFKSVILPVGIAVGLYFVARMLLASDAKDVATFRKRAIATGIVVAVGFALPGLMAIMKQVGELVNAQLK